MGGAATETMAKAAARTTTRAIRNEQAWRSLLLRWMETRGPDAPGHCPALRDGATALPLEPGRARPLATYTSPDIVVGPSLAEYREIRESLPPVRTRPSGEQAAARSRVPSSGTSAGPRQPSPPCRRGRARNHRGPRRHGGAARARPAAQPCPGADGPGDGLRCHRSPSRAGKSRARKRTRRASGALRRESDDRPRAAGPRIRVRFLPDPRRRNRTRTGAGSSIDPRWS